jgi:hypothetical protein
VAATLTSSSIGYARDNGSFQFRDTSIDTLAKTTSVDAAYSDPDLLIKEYFSSSLERRSQSRRVIAHNIRTVRSVLAVLSWGASGKVRDSYDGAVNLLAEITDLRLLVEACNVGLSFYPQMRKNPSQKVFAENFIEILIKAIACAYKVDANQRFRLLKDISRQLDRRTLKAAIIDAFITISDEVNLDSVKEVMQFFSDDLDQYIRHYVEEALQDIA